MKFQRERVLTTNPNNNSNSNTKKTEAPLPPQAWNQNILPKPRDWSKSHHPEPAANEHITVDEAIKRLGLGKVQFYVLMVAGLCFALDAMRVLLLSFLCEVLKSERGFDGQ
jgi:hypothetical protein